MALQTDVGGSVACAFPSREGRMWPADAMWGWFETSTQLAIQAYVLAVSVETKSTDAEEQSITMH